MVLFFKIICFCAAVLKGKLISLRTKNRSSAAEVDTSDFYASQQRISQNPTVLHKYQTTVFANFLSATVKLRAPFSSAGEQFQANRQLSVALKPAVQRRKIYKNENNTVKENHARKGTLPCEGVEGSGENRNSPPLFAILAFKMAKPLIGTD